VSRAFRASEFSRIAFRATGGRVKAIFWHLGVRSALEERGFRFITGIGEREQPAAGDIGLYVGSSAGSVFSLLVNAGFDVPDILESFLGRKSKLPPITSSTIFRRHRPIAGHYVKRIRNAINLRAGEELFPGTGIGHADAGDPPIKASYDLNLRKFARHFRASDLLVIRAPYVLDDMEKWLRSLVPDHDRFEDLRADAFFLSSDLDDVGTTVFGAREQRHSWYRYVKGIPMSTAAIASMAIPSVFNPVPITVAGRKHYFIDGDVYNPTEPMVEHDHNCDLSIVSSFEAPYRFHPAIGSLHHLGLPYEMAQTIALTIYSRFLQNRNSARTKAHGLAVAREILSQYVDEETLERECARIAGALEISAGMKIVHIHPFKNPLLFFGNPFDLSPRGLAKMVVEAYLQASELLEREGFHSLN
jgi:predicted acylesterase/phospholipase RssA